jgi:hypothetical protein
MLQDAVVVQVGKELQSLERPLVRSLGENEVRLRNGWTTSRWNALAKPEKSR